jgi:Family of unknown function (DUF5675)
MDIILHRTEETADGVFGILTDSFGSQLAVTIEHAYDSGHGDGSFTAKIPAGEYTCQRRHSPHFGFDVFEVLDVPNCTFIEIHPGNTEKDSEGCILLGSFRQGNDILESRKAFDAFMAKQINVDKFTLTVE